MAPTLRSSAPNTPNGKSTSSATPSSLTPRKIPTCTKCKRPRSGHPRSGCPYVISRTTTEQDVENAGQTIADALGTMHLQSPSHATDDDTRATLRQRRRPSLAAALATTQSVLSLDTEAQESLDELLQPGMFDNSPRTPATAGKVMQSQETSTPTRSIRKRVKMPGSLSSPSPYSSQEAIKMEEVSPIAPINDADDPLTSVLNPTPPASIPTIQPLVRSMSMDQREAFLSVLNNKSDASIYTVPRNDIHDIQAGAIKVGFFARVVLGKDASDTQGLLILGRDETAVKRLHEQIEVERKQSTNFRAATAGAVVGAVGAFAGLAFA